MLKKLFRMNLDDVAMFAIILCGVSLLLQLIIGGVMFFEKPQNGVVSSGFLLMIVCAGLCIFIGVGHILTTFVHAVQFGSTRRRALGLSLGLIGVEAVICLVLAGGLSWLEWAAGPTLWEGLSGHTLLLRYFLPPWWTFPLGAAVGCGLGLVLGTLVLRFGRRIWWILWCGWMAVCILGPHLPEYNFLAVLPVLAVLAAAVLVWSAWTLLRIPMR